MSTEIVATVTPCSTAALNVIQPEST